jgi:chemotaxis response regulator CheB
MNVGPGPIRILVVGDFAPWRDAISSLLKGNPAWRIVAETSDGLDAVQKA